MHELPEHSGLNHDPTVTDRTLMVPGALPLQPASEM
jgi:hypothetical protein